MSGVEQILTELKVDLTHENFPAETARIKELFPDKEHRLNTQGKTKDAIATVFSAYERIFPEKVKHFIGPQFPTISNAELNNAAERVLHSLRYGMYTRFVKAEYNVDFPGYAASSDMVKKVSVVTKEKYKEFPKIPASNLTRTILPRTFILAAIQILTPLDELILRDAYLYLDALKQTKPEAEAQQKQFTDDDLYERIIRLKMYLANSVKIASKHLHHFGSAQEDNKRRFDAEMEDFAKRCSFEKYNNIKDDEVKKIKKSILKKRGNAKRGILYKFTDLPLCAAICKYIRGELRECLMQIQSGNYDKLTDADLDDKEESLTDLSHCLKALLKVHKDVYSRELVANALVEFINMTLVAFVHMYGEDPALTLQADAIGKVVEKVSVNFPQIYAPFKIKLDENTTFTPYEFTIIQKQGCLVAHNATKNNFNGNSITVSLDSGSSEITATPFYDIFVNMPVVCAVMAVLFSKESSTLDRFNGTDKNAYVTFKFNNTTYTLQKQGIIEAFGGVKRLKEDSREDTSGNKKSARKKPKVQQNDDGETTKKIEEKNKEDPMDVEDVAITPSSDPELVDAVKCALTFVEETEFKLPPVESTDEEIDEWKTTNIDTLHKRVHEKINVVAQELQTKEKRLSDIKGNPELATMLKDIAEIEKGVNEATSAFLKGLLEKNLNKMKEKLQTKTKDLLGGDVDLAKLEIEIKELRNQSEALKNAEEVIRNRCTKEFESAITALKIHKKKLQEKAAKKTQEKKPLIKPPEEITVPELDKAKKEEISIFNGLINTVRDAVYIAILSEPRSGVAKDILKSIEFLNKECETFINEAGNELKKDFAQVLRELNKPSFNALVKVQGSEVYNKDLFEQYNSMSEEQKRDIERSISAFDFSDIPSNIPYLQASWILNQRRSGVISDATVDEYLQLLTDDGKTMYKNLSKAYS